MGSEESHALGYRRVDDHPDVPLLLDTMDATAEWEATRRLRGWEREQLRSAGWRRLLDVGCGLGEAALALADDRGGDGEVVGVDRSAEMVRVARMRATGARCNARFSVGDACALEEPDGAFDVVRSERTLQWLPDPAAAVAEMERVVRPGGYVSLIDTDWSTFGIDVGDEGVARLVRRAMQTERARPSHVGARLHELAEGLGLEVVARTQATQAWTAWDPDGSPTPDGCFSMASLADDLVDADLLAPGDRDRFATTIHDAARRDRFSMTLTMHAVVARSPSPGHG